MPYVSFYQEGINFFSFLWVMLQFLIDVDFFYW